MSDSDPSRCLAAELERMGACAREASRVLRTATTAGKNAALESVARSLEAHAADILAANVRDHEAARAEGLAPAMLDRLTLTRARLGAIVDGVRAVAGLPDPVGTVLREWTRTDGLRFRKVSVPIGVIGMIYESRPNVTVDAAVLCLKAGNAVILRGGRECLLTNRALAAAMSDGLAASGLPAASVSVVPSADREAVRLLCGMDRWIDCLIPRGGRGLIETVVAHARMPVIKHYDGICAIYVDAAADPDKGVRIVVNAKCQRPGVCNAAETLLVHSAVAPEQLPLLAWELWGRGVVLRACPRSLGILGGLGAPGGLLAAATEEDFRTEFLDLVMAVKVVDSLNEAVAHIETHGSHHSDAIVTEDAAAAARFQAMVDSSTVYWNASTRFTDGGEFGFGAEIGISTDRLHARGPMGLQELTTYKYLVVGDGHVR